MPATPSTRPPSKEDLAALDALLNSRSVEGPLTPLEKGGGVDRSYEPRFGQPRRAQRGSRLLPVLLGGAAVVVLGGAAAGGWYYMHRGAAPAHVAARTPPPPATTSPSTTLAAAPTTTEVAAPTTTLAAAPPTTLAAPPTTVPPPTTTLAARPTPAPKPTPAATRPSGGDALSQARALLQKSQFPDAARAFAQHLKTAPGTAWSVQILVACSDETVGKAVAAVAAPELFIIPVNFKGRDCYRLCWGLYETESRAGTAAQSVPEYFRKGGAHPKVVGTSSILP